jgi:serine-type D-Ala-D-Ala carboxypeptidase/endopeptidase (penicillin-binding protein 4)
MNRFSRPGMTRPLAAVVLGLLLSGGGCVKRTPPTTVPPPGPPAAAVVPATPAPAPARPGAVATAPAGIEALRADFGRIFENPAFGRMQWAVLVQSLATGETVYSENAPKLMMPASNMKILTLAAAAERLGWDYTYETTLVTAAPVVGGILKGDLIVVGSGDPTIGGRGGSATRVFEDWADRLRAAGLTGITGRIVADARAFDRETLGAGWSWDDLGDYYAAGVSALQFNESVADVAIKPGMSAGQPAVVEVRPIESGLIADSRVTTSAGGEPAVEVSRLAGSNRLVVRGTVPVGARDVVRAATVDRPALYFARILREVLVARGIRVGGAAGEYEDVYPVPPTEPTRVLMAHQSAPLSEFARVLMKVSQNQYAETLLRTLGARSGTGTADAGRTVVREVLDGWEIPRDAYIQVDGSGLSRYNYVCAETLVTILRKMYSDPRHKEPFLATLPIGGQDGSISRRFVGTAAAGNVRAKTGSIANVRALSGYVTSADGEPLVFAIIANNFTAPQSAIDAATDEAVVRLATFVRKASGTNSRDQFNH